LEFVIVWVNVLYTVLNEFKSTRYIQILKIFLIRGGGTLLQHFDEMDFVLVALTFWFRLLSGRKVEIKLLQALALPFPLLKLLGVYQ
jgi:hypothetical protein